MTLLDRKTKILNAAVESFIARGEPISSQWLYEHYRFGIKPAMIRHELEALTNEGYLIQPYRSAGRVPHDKGFKFFANDALRAEQTKARVRDKELSAFLEQHAWGDLLAELAEELGVLGVIGDMRGAVVKEGLECLIEHFVWERPEEVRRVVRDFSELDEHIEEILREEENEPLRVFVGTQSPITKSEGLSSVIGRYRVGGADVIVCAIGPKRMDYRRTFHILRSIGDGE